MKDSKQIKQRGFGIIEVLLSGVILIAVVGAAVALGAASVRSSVGASDKTTAYHLAQEGLEIVRQMRDTAWVDGNVATDWGTGLPLGNSYAIGRESGKWRLFLYSGTDDLTGGTNGQDYIELGEPAIRFYRRVKIEKVNWYSAANTGITNLPANSQDRIRKVKVEVMWQGGNGTRTITAETYLTDWKSY